MQNTSVNFLKKNQEVNGQHQIHYKKLTELPFQTIVCEAIFPFPYDSLQVVFKENQVNQKHQSTIKTNHDIMHREIQISVKDLSPPSLTWNCYTQKISF